MFASKIIFSLPWWCNIPPYSTAMAMPYSTVFYCVSLPWRCNIPPYSTAMVMQYSTVFTVFPCHGDTIFHSIYCVSLPWWYNIPQYSTMFPCHGDAIFHGILPCFPAMAMQYSTVLNLPWRCHIPRVFYCVSLPWRCHITWYSTLFLCNDDSFHRVDPACLTPSSAYRVLWS